MPARSAPNGGGIRKGQGIGINPPNVQPKVRIYSPPETYKATQNTANLLNRTVGKQVAKAVRNPASANVFVRPAGTIRNISKMYNSSFGTKASVAGYAPENTLGKRKAPTATVATRNDPYAARTISTHVDYPNGLRRWYNGSADFRQNAGTRGSGRSTMSYTYPAQKATRIPTGTLRGTNIYQGNKGKRRNQPGQYTETQIVAHEVGHILGLNHPSGSATNRPMKFNRATQPGGGGVMGGGIGYTRAQQRYLKTRLSNPRRKYGGAI